MAKQGPDGTTIAASQAAASFPAEAAPALVPVLAGFAICAFAGLAGIVAIVVLDAPVAVGVALPFATVFLLALLSDTHLGLCVAAFGIGPLGVLQQEVGGVTIDLPEAIILALVVKEALRLWYRGERLSPLVPSAGLLLFTIASLVGIATGLRSGNPPVQTLQDFRQFTEYALLFLLVLQRVGTLGEVKALLACFVAGGTLIGLHGILQHFTFIGIRGDQVLSDLIYHKTVRVGSFYGATALGAFMVLTGGAALGLALSASTRRATSAWMACVGVCLVAAIFSDTRAAWLAYVLMLAVVFLLIRKRAWIVVAAVLGAVAIGAMLGPLIAHRLETFAISKSERSLLDRVNYYTAAWHIFRERPVFGLGWGCYYDIRSILANRRYVHVPQTSTKATATVHSAYLQLLVKVGALGLLTFIGFLAQGFWRIAPALVARGRDEPLRELLVCLVAGVTGYLFHATFENFFQWPLMAQSFWLMLALIAILAHALGNMAGADTVPAPTHG